MALIHEKLQLTQRLQEILDEERVALERQDTAAIDSAAATKSQVIDQLQAKDNARTRLCEAHGFKPGVEQMQRLMESCDNDGLMQSVWQQLMALAAECRSMNMTNGAIIRLRQQHFASSLAVLSGTELNLDTYGSHGETAARPEGRAIATA